MRIEKKNILILFFACFCNVFPATGIQGKNVTVILCYDIKIQDFEKIIFRSPAENKTKKNDMTSIVDTLFYHDDTLFVSYKTNEQYCHIDTARDGSLIYSGMRTTRTIVKSATFTQRISVPRRPKYICLDNHDYCFFFVKDGFKKYRLKEYHLWAEQCKHACNGPSPINVKRFPLTPYGEDWADVQNFAETRYPVLGAYAFSGKEKDYESALLYFGARYHDAELTTMWLSVDPMTDKYPEITPYHYCHWNPVKLVDPEGRDFDPWMETYSKKLEDYCTKKIQTLENTENRTAEQNEKLAGYRTIISEIDKLRNDHNTLYRFGAHTGGCLGLTSYGGEYDYRTAINITLNARSCFDNGDDLTDKGIQALAHELKHAFQYYSGQLGYAVKNGAETQPFCNEKLETQAYDRSALFGGDTAEQMKKIYPQAFMFRYEKLNEFISDYEKDGYTIIKHK